jgi:PleD family two-component response regulator
MPQRVPVARPVDLLIASTDEWRTRSLASILAPHGYVVHSAYNRAQTLTHINSKAPDAIIIDEVLPDGDGYALARELSEENLITPSTPVFLALTRPPTRRDRLAARHAGAWECLGEPLDAEELTAMLEVFVPAKIDTDRAVGRGLVDDATELYNARGLMRRVEELAAHAARRHAPLGCIYLIAEIKPSGAEEEALADPPLWLERRIAAVLRSTARQSDAIGRLGPNSFAVVANDTDAGQARQLATRLAAAITAASSAPIVPRLPQLAVRAGYHGVPHVDPPFDVKAFMLHASVALRRARADSGDWLQAYSA